MKQISLIRYFLLSVFLMATAFGCSSIDWTPNAIKEEDKTEEKEPTIADKLATPEHQGIVVLDCEFQIKGAFGIGTLSPTDAYYVKLENYVSASGRIGSYRHKEKLIIPRLDPGSYVVKEVHATWIHMSEEQFETFHVPPTTEDKFIITVEAGKVTYGGKFIVLQKKGFKDRGTTYDMILNPDADVSFWEQFFVESE